MCLARIIGPLRTRDLTTPVVSSSSFFLLQEQRQRESASKGIFQIFRVLKFKGGVIPGARAMKLSSSQSVRGAGGRSARAVFLLASWKGRIE